MKLRIRDVVLGNEVVIMDYVFIQGKDLNSLIGNVEFKFKVFDYIVESSLIVMYYRIMRLQGPRSILIEIRSNGTLNRVVENFVKEYLNKWSDIHNI